MILPLVMGTRKRRNLLSDFSTDDLRNSFVTVVFSSLCKWLYVTVLELFPRFRWSEERRSVAEPNEAEPEPGGGGKMAPIF